MRKYQADPAPRPSSLPPRPPRADSPATASGKTTETVWEKTKKYSGTAYSKSKPGFDAAWKALDKLGAPVNRLSNRLGSEAFWPTTMDKESDKAARILRSFCKDGFYEKVDENQAKKAEESGEKVEGPQGKQRVIKKIPEKVIRQARGLAIFTTMRTGFWVSGAGGSGVLIARNPETGEWSPPSGILLHTYGLGFLIGVDIYDCVVVINTDKALESFMKLRATLGGEISAVAGPIGIGGVLDTEVVKRQAPVWTYLKSRGFYAGVQVDGTLVVERTDENEKFYGQRIPVADILAGKAKTPPVDKYRILTETIKAAQGDEVDEDLLPEAGTAPGDQEIEAPGAGFGIPDPEDPDPYGVKALEAEGLNIREAGTHSRPSAEVFEFKPAPSSPIYPAYARRSADSPLRERTNSWRGSMASLASMDRGTQTDDEDSNSNHNPEKKGIGHSPSPIRKESQDVNDEDHEDLSDGDEHDEAEIATATPVMARARVVSMPKRVPPNLPPRNPSRVSTQEQEQEQDLNDGFDQVNLNGLEHEASQGHDAEKPGQLDTSRRGLLGDGGSVQETEDGFHSMPQTPDDGKEGIPGSFE